MGFDQTWGLLARKLTGWGQAFILALPNFLLAVLTVVLSWLVAKAVRNVVLRLLRRISQSEQVTYLLAQMVYIAVLTAGTFIALGILGLQKTVASLLAGAGIVGLALGFGRPLPHGLQIVRYSPKERNLPNFAGEDALIRWRDLCESFDKTQDRLRELVRPPPFASDP